MHLDLVCNLSQKAERKRETDCVRDQGPAITRLKAVLMPPQLVRATQLEIDKTMRRLPLHYFTPPAQRDAVNAQAVVDESSLLDRLGLGLKNLEVQPRRGQLFQVLCPREKVEDLRQRAGHLLRESQSIGFICHRLSSIETHWTRPG